jgi:hypothetical protein
VEGVRGEEIKKGLEEERRKDRKKWGERIGRSGEKEWMECGKKELKECGKKEWKECDEKE